MSMISDPAVFKIEDPRLGPDAPKPKPETAPSQIIHEKKAPKPQGPTTDQQPVPIKWLKATSIKPDSLSIEWEANDMATDYHLSWDKGEGHVQIPLAPSTSQKNHFTLVDTNSGGVIGSKSYKENGGTY